MLLRKPWTLLRVSIRVDYEHGKVLQYVYRRRGFRKVRDRLMRYANGACMRCSVLSEFPINGLCTSDPRGNNCLAGRCIECTAGYFFHGNGCYSIAAVPGNGICVASQRLLYCMSRWIQFAERRVRSVQGKRMC